MNLLDYIGKEDQITHEIRGDIKAILHFEGDKCPIMVVFIDRGIGWYSRAGDDSSNFKIKEKPKKTYTMYKLDWCSLANGSIIIPAYWHPTDWEAKEASFGLCHGEMLTKTFTDHSED
jgi:hypothetical protein